PFGEPAPRLDLHAMRAGELLIGVALKERVDLDLVGRRRHLVVVDEVDESVGVEVRQTDRADEALAVQLLHGSPGAVVVTERLMDSSSRGIPLLRTARPTASSLP